MSFLNTALPANVALQSFDLVLGTKNTFILRLRHLFAAGEHPTLSLPVTVNLMTLFDANVLKLTSVQPTTLNANDLSVETEDTPTSVTLTPLVTKTFLAVVEGV